MSSQIQYRENCAGHIAVGYVVTRSFQSVEIEGGLVGGLVFSAYLDKSVLFWRQFMLGNQMSSLPLCPGDSKKLVVKFHSFGCASFVYYLGHVATLNTSGFVTILKNVFVW